MPLGKVFCAKLIELSNDFFHLYISPELVTHSIRSSQVRVVPKKVQIEENDDLIDEGNSAVPPAV